MPIENRITPASDFIYGQPDIRDDHLTGLPNLMALLHWAKEQSEQLDFTSFSLIAIHLLYLAQLKSEQGAAAGDNLLKWCAGVLREQRPGRIFRAGGDKFTILVNSADFKANADLAERLAGSVDLEQVHPGLRPTRSAVIHFSNHESFAPGKLLTCLYVGLSDTLQIGADRHAVVVWADSIPKVDPSFPWMLVDLAEQVLRLGYTADETLRMAHTDSISQLPNMRAAMNAMESAVASARKEGGPLAVLLIDGDNLRQYNEVSYEAGDEVIRLLAMTLQRTIRQRDFLARWRVGDEFLVLMPDTPVELAQDIALRLCDAVSCASASWLFPSTISIGVAVFPDHGVTVEDLIRAAEGSLAAAKKMGKNQVSGR